MIQDYTRYRDPVTKAPLRREGDRLVGPGQSYPLVNDIPRFVEPDNYAADFGRQWNRFPRTQLDSHSGVSLSADRLQRCLGAPLETLHGRRVLEAGSGAGRFTEVLLDHGADLDSFDYSAAVEANAANNGARPFQLAQADIRFIPFQPAAYDLVICLGVLQHTLDTEESIARLWDMVRPGGTLVIDHYRWNLWLRLPPPLGDAEKLYRWLVLRLPRERRWPAVKRLVDFWFPIHWRLRGNWLARKLLPRIAGIHFYHGQIDLPDRQAFYEWALLDTHDGMTDAHKRYRTVAQIRATLESLGATDIQVWAGGNGVEARCVKPA